ncbi:MAG: terpene cyclase/mutase family protein [Planctomycetota bacterium]|nr:terpene cyclase/mutase family protein [Planctomycetota bacterium]
MKFTRRALLNQMTLALGSGVLFPDLAFAQEAGSQRDSPGKTFFDKRTRDAVDAGLAYLAARQTEEGTFGIGPYQSNLAVCGLCGMAFLSAGNLPGRGKYGGQLNGCIDYILANARDSGFIQTGESNTRGPMYEHGFATLFLAEAYGTSPKPQLRQKLTKAVQLIINTQNDEGGWRYEPRRDEADLSVTVCQVMALRAAHNTGVFVPKATIDRAIAYVERCQNDDGGFAYMANAPGESRFPRSAAALVAMYNAGIYEGEVLTKGLAYVMQFPPNQGLQDDRQYYFYGHYYAAQAMWHAGGRYWEAWYPAIREALLDEQQANGSWSDAISSEYGTAMACLILRMPESYLPIFER